MCYFNAIKRQSVAWLILCAICLCSLPGKAQLPVWPQATHGYNYFTDYHLAAGGAAVTPSPHGYQDFPTNTYSTVPGTNTIAGGSTQAGINDCGELVFFVLHNGSTANNSLELFKPDGTPLTLAPSNMNANRGDDEVQVVKRPGTPNQYYIIYSLTPNNTTNQAYYASFLAYSLVEVNSGSNTAAYVTDGFGNIKDRVISAGGGNQRYLHGKATSRVSITVGALGHDLYAQRRTDFSPNFQVDRFEITNAGIVFSQTSGVEVGYWWGNYGANLIAGSPIELDPTETRLCVTARTQVDSEAEFYFFTVANLTLPPTTIDLGDMDVVRDIANAGITGYNPLTTAAQLTANELDLANGYLAFVGKMERKISSVEFSPNGQYLYFTGGGFEEGGYGNVTFLGQIDLTINSAGNYDVRLQVQDCPGWNFAATTSSDYGKQDNGTAGWNGWGNWTTNAADGADLDAWHPLSRIQSARKFGQDFLYFTKARTDIVHAIRNPNNPLPVVLVPGNVDPYPADNFQTVGTANFLPDQIDGWNYFNSSFTQVQLIVNTTDCEGNCLFIDIDVVDGNGNVFTTLTVDECPDTFLLCVLNDEVYDLVGSNGVVFDDAITNGTVNYPPGEDFFDFNDGSVSCCPALDGLDESEYLTIDGMNNYINTNTVWDDKVFIEPNTILTVDGVTLDVTNVDVIFGQCAGIDFINGAFLRTNNSVYRPCDRTETWRGLNFRNDSRCEVNESTFKNAEICFFFFTGIFGGGQSHNEGNITNNLFSNCNYSILSAFNTFDEPITGNTFYVDDEPIVASCYNFGAPDRYWGIYGVACDFNRKISQNDFIVADGAGTVREFNGIDMFLSSGEISSNNFTDNYRSISVRNTDDVVIENNEIEATLLYDQLEYQISVSNSSAIWISGNRLTQSSPDQFVGLTESAIYLENDDNVNVKENVIEGFSVAVQLQRTGNSYIGENDIRNAEVVGVYQFDGVNNTIACNTINMDFRSSILNTGIFYAQTTQGLNQNRFQGNCISEADFAIYCQNQSTGAAQLPIIRNNYLYNYSLAGVTNVSMSGDLGFALAPYASTGRNSFISNNIPNGAIDVQTNVPMIAAGNFGISSISAGVTLLGNNLYNSTATCGNQIGTVSAQIDQAEQCDDFINDFGNILVGNGNNMVLNNGFAGYLADQADSHRLSYTLAAMRKINRDGNAALLADFVQGVEAAFEEAEGAWVTYHHALLQNDLAGAQSQLGQISANDTDEADLLALEQIYLTQRNTLQFRDLDATTVNTLETIVAAEGKYAEVAGGYLRNAFGGNNYRHEPVITPSVTDFGAPIILEDEGYLNVFPNPAGDEVTVNYLVNNLDGANLEVLDPSGKLVMSKSLAYNAQAVTLDVSTLAEGVYIIALVNENGTRQYAKLVKQ